MTGRADADERELPSLVARAKEGDRDALEQIVRAAQDKVYGLAIRMLGEPAEAEDATQEILVKIVVRLESFRGESSFLTWVYAVAANHLRTVRSRSEQRRPQSFEQMCERQDRMLPDAQAPTVERTVLTREIRLLCLHGLLLCLDRDHRLVYVLAEGLGLSGVEGAAALGIHPDAFRKRLSRARQRMRAFMVDRCGLVRSGARCRCELWGEPALESGFIDPDRPKLCGHPMEEWSDDGLEQQLSGLDELGRISALFRSLPAYRAPSRLVTDLHEMLTVERGGAPRA